MILPGVNCGTNALPTQFPRELQRRSKGRGREGREGKRQLWAAEVWWSPRSCGVRPAAQRSHHCCWTSAACLCATRN